MTTPQARSYFVAAHVPHKDGLSTLCGRLLQRVRLARDTDEVTCWICLRSEKRRLAREVEDG